MLAVKGKFFDQTVRRFCRLEYRLQFRLTVKVELYAVVKALTAKRLHCPRLADLTCALQQYWLLVRSIFPLLESIDYISFYSHITQNSSFLCISTTLFRTFECKYTVFFRIHQETLSKYHDKLSFCVKFTTLGAVGKKSFNMNYLELNMNFL